MPLAFWSPLTVETNMKFERISGFAKSALQKTGFDVVRFRSPNTIFAHHGINLVLDVGANAGQYARDLRKLGYRGRIVSFEPQKQPFAALSAAAARDGNWAAENIGLGSEDSQLTINVHADSRLSSVLTFSQQGHPRHVERVNTEVIDIRTLDGVIDRYAKAGDRILLKIDTQGFEKQVLAGAEQSLPRLTGIQIELSLTPLYHGQPYLDEMAATLRHKGFSLWQIQRGLWNPETGQEMEVDGIFIRSDQTKH